jgi:hypothetical protein
MPRKRNASRIGKNWFTLLSPVNGKAIQTES